MKKQSEIPEDVLKRWWWRRLVFIKFDEVTHTTTRRLYVPERPQYAFSGEWRMWHTQGELTAFRFEFLRRTYFTDLPEFDLVPGWLQGWILGVIKPKPGRSVCAMFAPAAPPGYAALDWMWDLTASDQSLCRSFLVHINEERQRIGLPVTNDPFRKITGKIQRHSEKRRGERNRQVSWLAVEAHDIMSFKVRKLTGGERSRLSKAQREIKAFEEPMKKAIKSAHEFTPEEKRQGPREQLYTRFIRENFVARFPSQLPEE